MNNPFRPTRRILLKVIGVGLPAAAVGASSQPAGTPGSTAAAAAPITRGGTGAEHVAMFFNADEKVTVDAIMARLIPADDLGPGAKEAGATMYLDRQLSGAFGSGANFYRSGPFRPGTPEQGYQLALTPAECYRLGLAALDRACLSRHAGRRFSQLDAKTQDDTLAGLESGDFQIDGMPGPSFFQMLLDGAIEGFFSDPIYGGNRDMAGWKLVGFPGATASFANDIERYDVPYIRPPVSIATAHAMPMHPPASPGGTHGKAGEQPR